MKNIIKVSSEKNSSLEMKILKSNLLWCCGGRTTGKKQHRIHTTKKIRFEKTTKWMGKAQLENSKEGNIIPWVCNRRKSITLHFGSVFWLRMVRRCARFSAKWIELFSWAELQSYKDGWPGGYLQLIQNEQSILE